MTMMWGGPLGAGGAGAGAGAWVGARVGDGDGGLDDGDLEADGDGAWLAVALGLCADAVGGCDRALDSASTPAVPSAITTTSPTAISNVSSRPRPLPVPSIPRMVYVRPGLLRSG